LAKHNSGFEKRQRELAKKQKKEAKRLKKAATEVLPVVNENTTSPPDLPPAHTGKDS
jgi:hypothetical protein